MTSEEFDRWVKHHGALFQMTTPADAALFVAWKPLVLPYDLEDFLDGSNYLAAERSTTFRTMHLDLIRQRIHARMHNEMRRRIEEEQAGQGEADCPTCFGTGVASVPHKDHVHLSQWLPPFLTHGIFCHCNLGQAKHQSLTRSIDEARDSKRANVFIPPLPLSWTKYEALVPNWADLLRWRADQKRKELAAKQQARHADLVSPLAAVLRKSIAHLQQS